MILYFTYFLILKKFIFFLSRSPLQSQTNLFISMKDSFQLIIVLSLKPLKYSDIDLNYLAKASQTKFLPLLKA